jgi:pimeloyl-ACP methyl ester carboxylesterase
MAFTEANGLRFYYELLGKDSDPLITFICGLGGQSIGWDEEFLDKFVKKGFRVLIYDNRDSGLSSQMPDTATKSDKIGFVGLKESATYSLWDMADDLSGILGSLGFSASHIVGISMGGMIAQCFASKYRDMTLSLCSIMSSTGNPEVGMPTPEALKVLLEPPPKDPEEYLQHSLRNMLLISGGGYKLDDEKLLAKIKREYDRAFRPMGTARQLMAILASGNREESLKEINARTLVIHGELDPLVTISGGEATARAIANAKFVRVKNMGHALSPEIYDFIAEQILYNIKGA